jgi:hypothetical protein
LFVFSWRIVPLFDEKSYNILTNHVEKESNMVNSGSVSNHKLLIYQALLNNISVLDQTNKSSLNSELFGQLLEQALLQADLTGSSQDSKASLLGSLEPINFSTLGLSTALLGERTNFSSLMEGLGSMGNENWIATSFQASIPNNVSNTGGTLQYQEIDVNTLNSRLEGTLHNTGSYFVEAGRKYQINPAFLAAVSMHETGNGSSNAARFKNNVAGMMGKNGLKSYASVEESIFDMARNLRENYLNEGKTTLSQIGAKYAPVGAANDPTGLNNHWVKGVQHYFDKMTKTDFS